MTTEQESYDEEIAGYPSQFPFSDKGDDYDTEIADEEQERIIRQFEEHQRRVDYIIKVYTLLKEYSKEMFAHLFDKPSFTVDTLAKWLEEKGL